MHIAKTTIISSIAAVLLITSSVATFAAPATSKASLNIRSGPGTAYRVVDTLYRGERVEVNECVSNGWCFIKHKGPDGWVSAKYLRPISSRPTTPKRPRYTPPIRHQQNPTVIFGFSMNSDGDFSFGLGVGQPSTHPSGNRNPKVCFYKGANFSGQKYCLTPGNSYSSLPHGWDNEVSSIRVINGATAKVCRWDNFRGGCWNVKSNVRNIGPRFNDRISSVKVY